MARLLSVNVGLPRDIEWRGGTVHTGIWKEPVQGRGAVRRLNVEGDGQGDLAGHGGEQRAVFVYQIESYRYWEERLGRRDFDYGQFGENFTVEGLPDDEVCIGDRYRIGTALFEVTQPRVTCYRVGIRMNEPRMAALLTSSGRPGFYLRVLEEGEVGAGDAILTIARGPERMTVAEVNALLYRLGSSPRSARAGAAHPGAVPGLAVVVRGAAAKPGRPPWRDGQRGSCAGSGGADGNARVSAAAGLADRSRERRRDLVVARADGRHVGSRRRSPGQFVVLRLRPRPDGPLLFRSYSLSGPLSDERYRVSVKVEPNGAAGSVPEQPRSRGRRPRRQRAARQLRLAAGRRAGGAAQRGNRRDARAGHAARPGGERFGAGGLVAARRAQWQVAFLRHGGAAASSERSRAGEATSATAEPVPDDRLGQDYDAPVVWG